MYFLKKLFPRIKVPFLFLCFFLFGNLVLRISFWALFSPFRFSPGLFLKTLFWGFFSDLSAGLVFFCWLFILFVFFYRRIVSGRFWRFASINSFFILVPVQIFLFFTEYFFFDEFNSRFNSVAVDYLIYPTEVFVNIWQSYNVPIILLACAAASLPFSIYLSRKVRKSFCDLPEISFAEKILGTGLFSLLTVISLLISPIGGRSFAEDRVVNEIGKNGFNSFIYAAYSHNLDYKVFYKTISESECLSRIKKLTAQDNAVFTDSDQAPVEKKVSSRGPEKKLNVVIVVVESFGSNFWGVLGRKDSLTPKMDMYSKRGLLFDNIYSIGNRTVRGLEGVLAGYPPMPAESVMKLKFSNSTRTSAQLFSEKGYKTCFIYGGRGLFDNMKPFAVRYGFDSFIEQKDYENPRFKNIWGVCDQDIFDKTLSVMKSSEKKEKPFFITIMTVSNHKPYTFPEGAIPFRDANRANAVRYTDFSIGEFLARSEKEGFFKNTLFVIIADHGARVYGSQEIPIKSYEIPLLFIGPGIKPGINSELGSSIDVSPTILDFLNFSYTGRFFGRSLLNKKIKRRWVPFNHNRSAGFYDEKNMVVLELNKAVYFYSVKGKSGLERSANPSPEQLETEKDAIAVFQTAWETYLRGLK